jgi:hypothetical protein
MWMCCISMLELGTPSRANGTSTVDERGQFHPLVFRTDLRVEFRTAPPIDPLAFVDDDGALRAFDRTLTAVPSVESFLRRLPPFPEIDILLVLLAKDARGLDALRPGVRTRFLPEPAADDVRSATSGPNTTVFRDRDNCCGFCTVEALAVFCCFHSRSCCARSVGAAKLDFFKMPPFSALAAAAAAAAFSLS